MPADTFSNARAWSTRAYSLPAVLVWLSPLLIAFAPVLAKADELNAVPASGQPASCRDMIVRIKPLVGRMPAGVEKTAAQQEIASAEFELKQGTEAECQTHAHNAAEAMRAHGAN